MRRLLTRVAETRRESPCPMCTAPLCTKTGLTSAWSVSRASRSHACGTSYPRTHAAKSWRICDTFCRGCGRSSHTLTWDFEAAPVARSTTPATPDASTEWVLEGRCTTSTHGCATTWSRATTPRAIGSRSNRTGSTPVK